MQTAIPFDLSYGQVPPAGPLGAVAADLLEKATSPPPQPDVFRDDFLAAVEVWENLLGREHVKYDAETLDRYARCTLPWSTRPSAILRPDGTREVSELVKIAHRYRIPLHPISRGKNWGYGDACAPTDGQVIVDLGRMNRILEVNEELAYAVIQPGVTQGQMYEHLESRGIELMVPVHGGGPDCSLIGNALERGYGITPIADHFLALTSIEAVLADGSNYRSPLLELGSESVARVFKWGVGPHVDGLFSQGNFGIMTQASILLAPRPKHIEAFFFTCDERSLPVVVDELRGVLRKLGSTCPSVNLMNDRRVLAMTVPFPHDRVRADSAIPPDILKELSSREGIAPWTGAGALYGEASLVRQARRIVRHALAPYCKQFVSVSEAQARRWERWSRWLPGFAQGMVSKRLGAVRNFLKIVRGEPNRVAHSMPYWRSKHSLVPAASDPGRDGQGLIWYSPLVPLQGESVQAYCRMVEEITLSHGQDPLITLTTLSDRLVDSTVPILYDTASAGERGRAWECYSSLLAAGRQLGFVPYRYPANMRGAVEREARGPAELLDQLKRAADPMGIIAPRRS